MATIVLACNRLSEESARDFLSRSTPDSIKAHIKGFSQRIVSPFIIPPTLLDFLVSCSYLIWDGDDYATDSFTSLIVAAIREKYIRSRRKLKLLAFKFKDKERIFCNNWGSARSILSTGSTPVTVTVNYVIRPESSLDSKYLDLGKFALEFTKATHIVAIGGGAIVGNEYRHTLTLARANPHRHFVWHIYPVCRTKADAPPATDPEKCFWDSEIVGLRHDERSPGLPNFMVIIY